MAPLNMPHSIENSLDGRQSAKPIVDRYNDAKILRVRHESDWRLASAYVLPRHYGSWSSSGPALYNNGLASTRRIAYDATGVIALDMYRAVLERIATPHNMKWHNLRASDTTLMNKRRVKLYFEALRDKLFKMRYDPHALFIQAISEVYTSLGAYGTGPMYLGQRKLTPITRTRGFFYRGSPLRDIFILLDDNGRVDTVFFRFFLNAR